MPHYCVYLKKCKFVLSPEHKRSVPNVAPVLIYSIWEVPYVAPQNKVSIELTGSIRKFSRVTLRNRKIL